MGKIRMDDVDGYDVLNRPNNDPIPVDTNIPVTISVATAFVPPHERQKLPETNAVARCYIKLPNGTQYPPDVAASYIPVVIGSIPSAYVYDKITMATTTAGEFDTIYAQLRTTPTGTELDKDGPVLIKVAARGKVKQKSSLESPTI